MSDFFRIINAKLKVQVIIDLKDSALVSFTFLPLVKLSKDRWVRVWIINIDVKVEDAEIHDTNIFDKWRRQKIGSKTK